MSIKGAIRELIGSRRYSKLQSFRKRLDRGEKTLRVGKFDLAFPHDHILPMIRYPIAVALVLRGCSTLSEFTTSFS